MRKSQRREVVFDKAGVRVQQATIPVYGEDEALIQLRLAGICSTDLELMRGYKGFSGVLGHEFVGDVIAGPSEWLGLRVVGQINVACGKCDMCLRHVPEHCRNRRVLGLMGDYDGAFADVFHLPINNLLVVPDHLTDEAAVFTEPLAAAAQIPQQIHIHPTDRVLVMGVGRLGLLVAQVLHCHGADVVGVVRHQRQRDLLRKWGILARFYTDLEKHAADIVIDCTGSEAGFVDALALVRPRGTLVLKSTYEGLSQVQLSQLAVQEITVIGSRCGPFDVALRLLCQIDVESMIDGVYDLQDAQQALEYAAQPGILKVLLQR